MGSQPYYILFAGVNGAGKSTLYKTGLWQHGSIAPDLPRVNSDEILVAHGWNWQSASDQLKAGKLAVKAIQQHLERGESFNQETTLTGRSIMRNVRAAHEAGFRIVLFYVCVDDPAIANARIAHRARIGGHSVEPAAIKRRYDASLTNLTRILEHCDEAYLYDNTVSLELEARFAQGELAYYNPAEPHLSWLAHVMQALGYMEISW